MKSIILLFLWLLGASAYALDAEEIQALSKKPHSRDGLLEELKVYPDAREYRLTVRTGERAGELKVVAEIKATQKVVDGKYLIFKFQPPELPRELIMVITFDREASVYRKWVLDPDDEVGESFGVALPKQRMISWTSKPGDDGRQWLSSEVYDDAGGSWSEVILEEGKTVSLVVGEVKKMK
jgi:hypothetical protein